MSENNMQQLLEMIQQMSTQLNDVTEKLNASEQREKTITEKLNASEQREKTMTEKLNASEQREKTIIYDMSQIKIKMQVYDLCFQEFNKDKTPEAMIESTKRMTEKALDGDVETAVVLMDSEKNKWFTLDKDGDRKYLDIENDGSPVANTLYNGKKQVLNNEDGELDLGDKDILQKKNRSVAIRPMKADDGDIRGAVIVSKNGDIPIDEERLVDHIADSFATALYTQKLDAENKKFSHDELTQLPNRHGITKFLKDNALSEMKQGTPASFVYMDIDNFKKFNTDYGHNGGDAVLKQVADIVQKHCRKDTDCGYRDGGEEIGAMLVGVNEAQAMVVAERIRNEIATTPFDLGNGQTAHVTASVGTAQFAADEIKSMNKENVYDTFYKTVKQRADANVDASKSKGKNCITGSKEATIEYNKLAKTANTSRYASVSGPSATISTDPTFSR